MRTKTVLQTAAAVLSALALSGCMKMDMEFTVSSDDKVDGVAIIALDREIADLSGMSPEELREELQSDLQLEDLPEGATLEPYEDENFIGSKVTLDGVSLDEFNEDSGEEDLRIVHEDGQYTVSGALDLTADELGQAPVEELSAGDAEMRIAITLPGDVVDHNGELSGRTITWHPKFGERNEIRAVAEDSEDGIPMLVWPLLGVAAFSIAMIFVIQTRRPRRSRRPAIADSAPPGYDFGP